MNTINNEVAVNAACENIILTSNNFKISKVGNYEFEGRIIVITSKISAYGSGKKTVYSGMIDGKAFEKWDICRIKRSIGIQICSSTKRGATIRVMTDEEMAALIEVEYSRAIKLYENFANFMTKYDFKVDDMAEVEIKDAIAYEISNKVAAARAAKKEADRKAAEKEAEKAAKEALKEAKAADKIRAAKVASASDLQKQMMDAVLAGDFAKLAELQKAAETAA